MRSLAGRYRVEQPVGHGGSAVVHSGYDHTLKRRVAIKLFSPYRPDSAVSSLDVLREARAAAALTHPNVARVYDYGEAIDGDQRLPYLVMEFLEGDTVADRLAAAGALAWSHAAEVCADVAAALAAAHAGDLVHRDVKPRNVMLTPAGVKVLDFGIAARAGQNSLDTHGQLWGTPAHLAPEQLRGEPTYPAADVYALGLLLFECLTGARAWPGTSVGEILAARYQRRAPRLPAIAGLPREIIRLYEACVADDPTRRPPAADVAAILRRAAGKASTVRPAAGKASTVRPAAGKASTVRPAAGKASTVRPAAGKAPIVRPAAAITRAIPPMRRKRSRTRATVTASIAMAAAFVSVIGLQVANGYSTPEGRRAEAAVDGAPATLAPQPVTTPTPTSTRPVRDVPVKDERPARRAADTWTREATSPPRQSKPAPKPSSEAPTTAPTTPPAGPRPTPSDPPPTSTAPEPSEPPASTGPPTEPTQSPPAPDPEEAAQDTVLAAS
ncbi:serine/threonine-protein kinase [Actinoplanes sp. ATCC 53533]|uniref:serine/threonine-protein kinase n=1 Tax=Actinoplanes sp. ATCC 53533 TaxID=1288362 RepID=UPI0013151386|nr:serine/threonine-protein kinase [Actinoplanes sp. ATCC 53533]